MNPQREGGLAGLVKIGEAPERITNMIVPGVALV